MEGFRALRERKLRVGPRWIAKTYRKHLEDKYSDQAKYWKGSPSWRVKFYRRNKLSLRRRTNSKKYGLDEAIQKLQAFLAGIQKRCKQGAKGIWDAFNGRYPRHSRTSADQVNQCTQLNDRRQLLTISRHLQVPFTFDMGRNDTIEETGKSRVQIFTGSDSDCKRMGTFQVILKHFICSELACTTTCIYR